MAQNDGVYVFQDPANARYNGGIDPALLLALSNGNGFGGMNNPFWMMFMLPFIYPFFGSMMGGWGNGWGGFGGGLNGGAGFLSNQLNNDAGRDLIMQAVQGNRDAIQNLAGVLNTDFATVNNGIQQMTAKLQDVGAQVGMSALQVLNGVQNGNATLGRQLCECCCENRLAIANQTNALQAQAAANHAAATLQAAQSEAADQLAVCQQTNALSTQADRNANSILNAIAGQNTLITKEFCDLKERELQNKIDTQGDIITQLRGQISNDAQSKQFNDAITALNEKITLLSAKQPNTVPVQYPNIVAANATPYVGGYGFPYGQTNFWN